MESAGLFPPFPAASAVPARPAPAPAPPPRAAETTRIITDPVSGRSYCKGRLLGKVPGMGKGGWAVAEGAGVSRCGRGEGWGLCACSTPILGGPGLDAAPRLPPAASTLPASPGGPAAALEAVNHPRWLRASAAIGAASVSGRPAAGAWAGGCPGSQGCRPAPLRRTQLFLRLTAACVGGGCRFPARPEWAQRLSVQIGG